MDISSACLYTVFCFPVSISFDPDIAQIAGFPKKYSSRLLYCCGINVTDYLEQVQNVVGEQTLVNKNSAEA